MIRTEPTHKCQRSEAVQDVGQLHRKSLEGYAQEAAPHDVFSLGWMIQVSRNG